MAYRQPVVNVTRMSMGRCSMSHGDEMSMAHPTYSPSIARQRTIFP
jgi:hypothetical protein